jgi:predicted deacylase
MTGTARKETRTITARQAHAADVEIPVGEIRGREAGPTACFVAGVHGAEYVGMEAVRRVFRRVDPDRLRGTLRCVFVANLPAFHARSEAITPIDGKNLNRVFPGRPRGGTYSEFLAHHIFEGAVLGSDLLVDCHGGDIFEALAPHVALRADGAPEVRERAARIAKAMATDFILMSSALPGGSPGGAPLTGAALAAGVPAVLSEIGGEGVLDLALVERTERGLTNVLVDAGMIEGQVVVPAGAREVYGGFWSATTKGVFYPKAKLHERVRAGQVIGEVWDYFGAERLEEIRAPQDAWIVAIVTCPATHPGSIVFQVGTETPAGSGH